MFSDNDKISARQLQILIVANNLGIGLMLLPKIFFGASMINFVLLLILVLTVKKFICATNREDFFSATKKNFLSTLLLIKIIFTTAIQLKFFSWIIKNYALQNTNEFVTRLILLLTAAYLISKGYEVRARLCEILIWLIILPLAIVFVMAIFNIERIIFDNAKINFAGIFKSLFIFSQLDYLFLSGATIKSRDSKKISDAILFTWLAIIFLTYIMRCRINFQTPLPILKLMSITDIPGGFIQNQDFFIISFVIISCFVLVSSGMFFAKSLLEKKSATELISLAIFFSSMLPNFLLTFVIYTLGSFFYFVLPAIMFIKNKKAGEIKSNL